MRKESPKIEFLGTYLHICLSKILTYDKKLEN